MNPATSRRALPALLRSFLREGSFSAGRLSRSLLGERRPGPRRFGGDQSCGFLNEGFCRSENLWDGWAGGSEGVAWQCERSQVPLISSTRCQAKTEETKAVSGSLAREPKVTKARGSSRARPGLSSSRCFVSLTDNPDTVWHCLSGEEGGACLSNVEPLRYASALGHSSCAGNMLFLPLRRDFLVQHHKADGSDLYAS